MKYVLIALLFLSSAPAFAAGKTEVTHQIGTFGHWRTYKTTEHNDPVCYMTLTAQFPKSQKFHRSSAFLTITHRPIENSKDVVSYTAGYNYKPMSSAELHIGKQSFSLFTSQDTAWSRDAATDHKIAAAIQSAPSLSITGTPAKKPTTILTDKFALTGATQAYRSIGKACGIEVPEKPKPKPAKTTNINVKKHH